MIDWINNWSQGVIISVVIATILEMLLPENKNRKYITSVIGVFILFTIISPIISKLTGESMMLNEFVDYKNINNINYSIDNVALLENDENIENLYIKTLKKDITNIVSQKGYIVDDIRIEVETKQEKNYGEILGVYLKVSTPESRSVSDIQEVKISIPSTKSDKCSYVSEGQLNIIREIIMDNYGIPKNKIHIN